ncbi:MAG: hypothetical protein IKP77_05485 [Acholeplasmatales bacterium]|nr:hypothetical protein [Acholeplasmatales bacterium]
MTFEEKIKNSDVIAEGVLKKGSKVKTKKSRWIGIIFSLAIIVYTLVSTILKMKKLDQEQFYDSVMTIDELLIVISFVAIFFKIIFSIVMAFVKKSIYSMNHLGTYGLLDALSNIDLIILFGINFYNYYTLLDLGDLWDSSLPFSENFHNMFLSNSWKTTSFVITLIINVPVLFKFLKFSLSNGLIIYISVALIPFAPFLLYGYLKKNNRVFYEFEDYDDKYYIVRKRCITKKFYGFERFIIKLLIVCIIAALLFTMSMFAYNKPLNVMTREDFYRYCLPYILIFGYIIALIYLFGSKVDKHLSEQNKELKCSINKEYFDVVAHADPKKYRDDARFRYDDED